MDTDPAPASAVDLAVLERHAARIAYYGQIGLGPLGRGGDRYLEVTDGDGYWAPFATVGDEEAEAIAALLNAAPALVAEVRRLRALAEAVRETFTPNLARDGYGKLWAALDALELWEQQP